MILLSGNANKPLAQKVAHCLNQPLGQVSIHLFQDGESHIEITERLQHKTVFILQSTSAPSNHYLMELCLMIHTAHVAGAHQINAIIPYFGYARDSTKFNLCAQFIKLAGAQMLLTMDLHQAPIFYSVALPLHMLQAQTLFLTDILSKPYMHNPIIIAPDRGSRVRAAAFANQITHSELIFMNKKRSKTNQITLYWQGKVENRTCIIIDDLIDTGNTICTAAQSLKAHGAKKIFAYITHPVLSKPALENIEHSPLDAIMVTDTIPLSTQAQACSRIQVLSIAALLADYIKKFNLH